MILSANTSKNVYSTLSGLNYKGPISTTENYWLDDWYCINTSGNVCPYIGKFAQGKLYTNDGEINSPSKNIKTANILTAMPHSTNYIGTSFKMNKSSQLGYYIGGLAGSNLGNIENSLVDINLNFGYNDRFVGTFGGIVGQSLSGNIYRNISCITTNLVSNYQSGISDSAISGQFYETILNIPSNFLKSYQRVIDGWTTYRKKNVNQIGGLIGETSCHDNIIENSAKLNLIDNENIENKELSAYDLINSEQTLLCSYGSLAAFAKIDMYTWDYHDLSGYINWKKNYLELNASLAIDTFYNSNNITMANPLSVIGETYIDYRIMPWIYSMNYTTNGVWRIY